MLNSLASKYAGKTTRPNELHVLFSSTQLAHRLAFRIGSMAPYYLNRNVALLLNSCHGVNASVFLEMQKKMLEDIDEMFTCSEAATSMISQLSGPDQEQRARLLNMLKCGLKVDVDPFLFSCCLAIRAHQLLGLRKKARVMVRKGAVVMGGLDVLKVLPEYCVFLQVRKLVPDGVASDMPELDEFEPIVGPVMVTKHPVMHPGDVRMLLAVDVPELRHHKNVILFSQLGGRPEADKMSGSDLDGDEFAVTWESRLFLGEWNKCSRDLSGHFVSGNGRVLHGSNIADDARILQIGNTEPMTYHDFTLPNSGSSLEVDDEGLMQHFLNFAKNDKLGPIGMLWQDWASKSGAGCDECLLLAHQHSVAVDFAKSGKPAEMPTETRWKGPRAHFREKKGDARSHYTCSSVVGMLYDQVKPSNELSTLQSFTVALAGRRLDRYGQVSSLLGDGDLGEVLVNNYNPSIPQRLGWLFDEKESTLAFQIPFEDIAEKEKKDYDYAVFQVMNKHELHNEGELATGCIRKFQALHKHRQHEVAEEVRRQGRQIYREGRTRFFRHVLNIVHATKVVCGLSSVLNSSVPDSPSGEESMVLAMQEMSISDGRQTSFGIVLDKGVLESSSSEHSKERLHWVESVATTERVVPPVLFSEEWIARLVARKLAAAYYLASYSPWRETGTKVLLFGFPWLVSDVIACGMSTTC